MVLFRKDPLIQLHLAIKFSKKAIVHVVYRMHGSSSWSCLCHVQLIHTTAHTPSGRHAASKHFERVTVSPEGVSPGLPMGINPTFLFRRNECLRVFTIIIRVTLKTHTTYVFGGGGAW
jgi:hypothetical protein